MSDPPAQLRHGGSPSLPLSPLCAPTHTPLSRERWPPVMDSKRGPANESPRDRVGGGGGLRSATGTGQEPRSAPRAARSDLRRSTAAGDHLCTKLAKRNPSRQLRGEEKAAWRGRATAPAGHNYSRRWREFRSGTRRDTSPHNR
ncbi:hypothetical protein SKAU_G00382660 [Synaphobranchus kaupii]|uniref:Uncharacterized protein n=1 Tax=Synaphobranchus kaupii TaxID=118154 RepID=A0A9Q1EE70_SYNKA|nr:hypothetical protein SKAU_G00382660 [Synaphobranchus kaupii]